jgi:hypothetical protein
MIRTFHDDFEVSRIVIERLAKYHAAGFFLNKEQVGSLDLETTLLDLLEN